MIAKTNRMVLDRRWFLRVLGLGGAAGLLAACGGASGVSAGGAGPTPSEPSLDELVRRLAPDAVQTLSVISGSYEQLTGTDGRSPSV